MGFIFFQQKTLENSNSKSHLNYKFLFQADIAQKDWQNFSKKHLKNISFKQLNKTFHFPPKEHKLSES